MSPHTFYPRYPRYPRVIPTVYSRRRKLARFLAWLAAAMLLLAMILGTASVITRLATIDAQLDSAFLQGMTAGQQVCPRGL